MPRALIAMGAAVARMPMRNAPATAPVGEATIQITAELPDGVELSDAAIAGMRVALQREADRFAQIVAVDLRDQKVARAERARIAAAPADRPHIIVAAGTKDPAAVVVLKGEYEIGPTGHKRTVRAETRS